MDERVRDLERRMDNVEERLDTVVHEVAELRAEVAERPTKFQMLTSFVGVALAVVLLVFAIARFA